MVQDLIKTTSLLNAQGGMFPALAFIALILGFIVYIFFLFYCLSSYRWSKVDGVITVSEMLESKERAAGSGSHRTTTFKPIVHYKYEVAGKLYENKKIRFFQLSSSSKPFAERTLKSFPEGASVSVYYNSKRPSSSVLVPGVSFGAFFVLSFFLLSIWMVRSYVM